MNYWVVPITIGKKRFRKIADALFSYQLSQYDSWIGNWGTAGDALTPKSETTACTYFELVMTCSLRCEEMSILN